MGQEELDRLCLNHMLLPMTTWILVANELEMVLHHLSGLLSDLRLSDPSCASSELVREYRSDGQQDVMVRLGS